jgi:hypothetical protein
MAEIINLSTYQNKAVAKKSLASIDNEEHLLHYLLWELTQSPSEIAEAKDSIALFFGQNTASIYQFVGATKKTA